MADTLRSVAGLALGLLLLYWLFATVARSEFGLDVPDPGDWFPSGWRYR
jgi:hypothetical protein